MASEKKSVSRYIILTLILLAGFILRVWGINFGLPLKYARPDEDQIVEAFLYLFTGDYNPHFYYYPHLFLYLNHFICQIIFYAGKLSGEYESVGDFVKNFIISPSLFFLTARFISAIVGAFTIWLTYITARRFYGQGSALFSSALLSCAYLHVRDSHFGTTDICLTAAIVAVAFFSGNIITEGKGYTSSAIAGGIAAGFKYNGALSAIFIFSAHIIHCIKKGKGIKGIFLDFRIYLSGLLMTTIFLATSPGLIADFYEFLDRMIFMAIWIRGGAGVNDVNFNIGWMYYLKTSLVSGIGIPFLLLSLAGIIYTLLKHREKDILILSFPLIYYFGIGNGYGVFSRYMIPVIPFLSIYAGRLLSEISISNGILKIKGRWLSIAIFLLALLPTLSNSIRFDILSGKTDTRVQARQWIEANIPAGSSIFLYGGYKYNLPYLERGKESIDREMKGLQRAALSNNKNRFNLYLLAYNYMLSKDIAPVEKSYEYIMGKRFSEDDIEKYGTQYFVTGEGFLDFYSGHTENAAPIIEKRFHLIKTFSPLAKSLEKPEKAVFDILDAFYLPLSGFEEFERPGPVIRIYAINREK